MSAPTVEHLQYRDPHAPRRGEQYTSAYTLADLEAMREALRNSLPPYHYHSMFDNDPCRECDRLARLGHGHTRAHAQPGWHGPLTALLHAEHEAREHDEAERRHAAHIAELALKARRSANPMWQRLGDVMPEYERCDEDVDAVMDAIYGEGRW
ncbi:hypothetical protein [Tsukamurella sp. NPDC003166]|uniref:hypothetical protein n=1 Tax=Tsukamurella sp. NPDC003166 TaxID=3154444 RepID=UPI0033A18411